MRTPSERLRWARQRAGLDGPKAAAEKFGWPYEAYKKHESGDRGIKLAAAGRYAHAFHVSAAWLLTGEGGADGTPEGDEAELLRLFRQLDADRRAAVLSVAQSLQPGAGSARPFTAAGSKPSRAAKVI